MTAYPSEADLDELQAYADRGPSVSRAACGRVVEALRPKPGGSFHSDPHHGMDWPWRIELKETWDLDEDRQQTILQGRIIPYRHTGHFELRVWYGHELVFFMTTDPREEVEDIPQVVGSVHMFTKIVEGKLPLALLLEHANRVKNKSD